MNANVISEIMSESQAGKLTFPEVVHRLLKAGVESYFIDFARGEEMFYMLDGGTHAEKMRVALLPVAEEFSSSGVVSAIRGAQTDTIRYPEFVKRATTAGVIGYWAFLTGKKVIYLARRDHFGNFVR